MIQKLCMDLGSGLEEADKLISNVTVTLTDTRSEQEVKAVTLAVTISVRGLDYANVYFPSIFI